MCIYIYIYTRYTFNSMICYIALRYMSYYCVFLLFMVIIISIIISSSTSSTTITINNISV